MEFGIVQFHKLMSVVNLIYCNTLTLLLCMSIMKYVLQCVSFAKTANNVNYLGMSTSRVPYMLELKIKLNINLKV